MSTVSQNFDPENLKLWRLAWVSRYSRSRKIEIAIKSCIIFSAYEVKNNCCLFERLFKVKKNGVFLLKISFFVMEIFTFLYYANEESDDVIGGSTKTVQHSVTNISRNLKAVFFKLGTRNQNHERGKMTPIVLLPWQQLCPLVLF